jgi:hypothetical protein
MPASSNEIVAMKAIAFVARTASWLEAKRRASAADAIFAEPKRTAPKRLKRPHGKSKTSSQ